MTTSSKSLFRAMKAKPKGSAGQGAMMDDMSEARRQVRPEDARRSDDFYPIDQPEALRALLARDGARIRAAGRVWEHAPCLALG